MKTYKQNADFLLFGTQLIDWYAKNARDLPFRKTKDSYKIWISEIIFQQTRIQQGLEYYNRFIDRFPTVFDLANAHVDDVLLYWKGLGYYSRAINLHKAAQQIVDDFNGVFPNDYGDIIKLKGVGKYTASAIASICFGEAKPAVDGNLYRVLSRFFADDFDISSSKAFSYFTDLALRMMPNNEAGSFNQAMMDLGSEICKPKAPLCGECPINNGCLAFQTGTIAKYPVKKKKTKITKQNFQYYYLHYRDNFLIRQRDSSSIWKRLYELATELPKNLLHPIEEEIKVNHILSHINMDITFSKIAFSNLEELKRFANENKMEVINSIDFPNKSFPKPIENFIYQQING